MTRSLSLLGALLFTFSALSQGIDFEVRVAGEDRLAPLTSYFAVHARWTGTEPAENVVLEVDFPVDVDIREYDETNCTPGHPIRCTLPRKNAHDGGFVANVRFPGPGRYTATARITSTTPDPNPANNVSTLTFVVAGLPWLRAYGVADLSEGDVIDPAGAGHLRIGVQNDGEPATDVILRAELLDGGHFTELDPDASRLCAIVTPSVVECRFGEVRRFSSPRQYLLPFVAPDRADGGTFRFRITGEANEPDFEPSRRVEEKEIRLRRLIAITSAADEGPGTLRQAILDSYALCETDPCLLGARRPDGLFIQPRTPLPALRGRVKLDGGPLRATIDGSLLPAGGGLLFENGCEFRVNSLGVQGFKGHGIEARLRNDVPNPCAFNPLVSTMIVTNSHIAGNERGVVTNGISATITDNVIRENVRAGIFADGAYYTEVARNVVVRNGATGIFIRPVIGSFAWLPPGADVINNIVHDNGEWGIARSPNGSVNIARNSIAGNRLYGIDYGLDLRTPDAPYKPELLSAKYDPARDATVIRVRFRPADQQQYASMRVELYASHSLSVLGYPEAERLIAEVHRTDLDLVVPGDLRGQWITATGTRMVDMIFLRDDSVRAAAASPRYTAYDTSELSDAIRVE
jgi:Right handed beta helix region/Domain of unknown function DUF11